MEERRGKEWIVGRKDLNAGWSVAIPYTAAIRHVKIELGEYIEIREVKWDTYQ